jgi:hypothetical protein
MFDLISKLAAASMHTPLLSDIRNLEVFRVIHLLMLLFSVGVIINGRSLNFALILKNLTGISCNYLIITIKQGVEIV